MSDATFCDYRHVSENSTIMNLEDYYVRRMAAFPPVIAHNILASASDAYDRQSSVASNKLVISFQIHQTANSSRRKSLRRTLRKSGDCTVSQRYGELIIDWGNNSAGHLCGGSSAKFATISIPHNVGESESLF